VSPPTEARELLETGLAALLFAAIFLAGGRLHPASALTRDRRKAISFGAGMAAAYVFVHVMPELDAARRSFTESVGVETPWEGMAVYLLALIGFLAFYGLEHMLVRLREEEKDGAAEPAYRIHVGGFAAYVALIGYLLVRNLEESSASTVLYAVGIGCHLLAVDHALRREHRAAYERRGRFVLAGMVVLGWGVGVLVDLPRFAVAVLVAFLSGAVIVNSSLGELPSEKDGRFVPFLAGGLLYGLILLPLG
jgi:hypothetical protein